MKTFRAIALTFAMLVTVASVRAGDGVLVPGGDKTPPPPPPSVSSPITTDATSSEIAGESDENLLLLYAAAIWFQLSGITILP